MTNSSENENIKVIREDIERKDRIRINKILVTVFSVLGSLLLGIGITILLVGMWEKFPVVGKTIVSMIPMLIGQAAAIFTYIKKRDNLIWKEGASVLWSVGVSATVGMMSVVMNFRLGVLLCLLIDALLVLPVLFFFKAATPLAFYYCAAIAGSVGLYNATENVVFFILALIPLMITGIIFTFKNTRNQETGARLDYCKWISVIASIVAVICICGITGCGWFMVLPALFVCLYALDKKEVWSSPFFVFGVVGQSFISVISTYITLYSGGGEAWREVFSLPHCISVLLTIGLFAVGFICGDKNFEDNSTKTAYCVCGALVPVFALINAVVKNETVLLISALGIFAVTIAQGVILVVKGAQECKFVTLNLGIVMLVALMFITISFYHTDLLVIGLMCIISGSALFGANFFLSKKIKQEKEQLSETVVENDE